MVFIFWQEAQLRYVWAWPPIYVKKSKLCLRSLATVARSRKRLDPSGGCRQWVFRNLTNPRLVGHPQQRKDLGFVVRKYAFNQKRCIGWTSSGPLGAPSRRRRWSSPKGQKNFGYALNLWLSQCIRGSFWTLQAPWKKNAQICRLSWL